MHPYALVPLTACIVSAAIALTLWIREPDSRPNHPIIAVSGAAAWWALCELAWNLSTSEDAALRLLRLAAPGWLALGPLAVSTILHSLDAPPARVQRALAVLYTLAGAALAVTWTTPWMIAGAHRTSWGWSPLPGPVFPFQVALTVGAAAYALWLWRRYARRPRDPIDRTRRDFVTLAMGIPLAVASLTDAALPLVGIHDVPRFGTLSLASIGVLHVVSFYRYGDSLLIPEGFTARVLQNVPEGLAAVSLGGRVRAANERLAELVGLPRERLIGRSIGAFLSVALFDPVSEQRDLECELRPLSGPPMAVSVSTSLQTDNLGVVRTVVVVVRDLREVVALRNRLLTSGRMAAVGELAAGIAHEINNPVTYVRANLSVLREHWRTLAKAVPQPVPAEIQEVLAEGEELIDESLEGVDRASAIVRDVREFSHGGSGSEAADVNHLLEQTLRVAGAQIPGTVRVVRSLGEVPLIECEPQRLKQVFMNLLLNAAQAIGEEGCIRVSSRALDDEVWVEVQDDGVGIPNEVIERIFDPFFTTKPVGEGTGLGLAIAFGIVERHAGAIEVQSVPGLTRFRVRLPAGPPSEAAART